MAKRPQRTERRADALSRQRIVEEAIELLDTGGVRALTFRALAARLSTGAGAIYWHVDNKEELLAAAAADVITGVLSATPAESDPADAIRTIALGLFDEIDAHPWVVGQLSGERPWDSAMLLVIERLGGQIQALGVPEHAWFDCGSVLVSYVFGAAAQNASNARLLEPGTDRAAVLASVADRWAELDPAEFPFVRRIAAGMPDHDDREQFLLGIDFILAGIERVR